MINCHQCGLPWAQKGFRKHQQVCNGVIGIGVAFKPVNKGKRYLYQCQKCFSCFRKDKISQHKCRQRQQMANSEKQDLESAFQPTLTLNKGNYSTQKKINEEEEDDDNQYEEKQKTFFFQNEPHELKPWILTSSSGKITEINQEDLQEDDQNLTQHRYPTLQALNSEAMKAAMASLCDAEPQFSMRCLRPFKKYKQSNQVDQDTLIQMYALSCMLRLIGRYVQQIQTWKQRKYLIQKKQFWKFLEEVQPWIINHKQRVEQKIEHLSHDNTYFYVKNFDQIYRRLQQLLGHFTIQPKKIQKIFKKACNPRKQSKRMLRCNPQTLKERRKFQFYLSRRKYEQKRHKKSYGIRQNTRQKYQNMKFWAATRDLVFKTKQIFRKKPSRTHKKSIEKKRKELMEEYCMKVIADDMTASIILGSFKVWSKSIEQIAPDQRYLYLKQIPDLPIYTVWYPIHLSFLKERKWYFPHIYNKCQGYFASPLPVYTEDELFRRVVAWYCRKNLLIQHSLVEADQFDELKAIVDHPYRIRHQEKKKRMKSSAIDINPRLRFPENVQSSQPESQSQNQEDVIFASNVPRRGNKQQWSIIHKNENKTEFVCCGLCQKEVDFPSLCCKQCLSLFHHQCREDLNQNCLCHLTFEHQQREKMMKKACIKAQMLAKKVDLTITKPPAANMMEIQFQERDLLMHLPIGSDNGMWCDPGKIKYDESSQICFLKEKTMKIIEKFETKQYIFPGIIKQVEGKGRGLIASRLIKKNQIVANYSGTLMDQATTRQQFPQCGYVYSFQKGKTSFSSWNVIPLRTASLGMFINHSKQHANVMPGKYWTSKGPLILFLASRQIKMNEQILYDYGQQYDGRQNFKQGSQP